MAKKKKPVVWTNKCANRDEEWHGGPFIPDDRVLCDNCLMRKHELTDYHYDSLDCLGLVAFVKVASVISALAGVDKQVRELKSEIQSLAEDAAGIDI